VNDSSPDQEDDRLVNNVFNLALSRVSSRANLNASDEPLSNDIQISSVQVQSISDSSAQCDSSCSGTFRVFIDMVLLYFLRFIAFFGRLSLTKLCVVVLSVGAIFLSFSGVNGVTLPRTFRHDVSCLNAPSTIRSPPLLINLQVENRSLLMEYDSGAAVSLIPLQYFIKNFNLTFKPTSL